jgi:hypothetical protein
LVCAIEDTLDFVVEQQTYGVEYMQSTFLPSSPLERLPDPESVRERIADLHAEARLLRRLLRLSQAAQEEREAPPSTRRPLDRPPWVRDD